MIRPVFLTLLTLSILYSSLPASGQIGEIFIENKGQWPQQAGFMGAIPGGYVWLMPDGFRFALFPSRSGHVCDQAEVHSTKMQVYDLRFSGSSTTDRKGENTPSGTSFNFFLGNNPRKWASNARGFNSVLYQNLYPGVDMRVYFQDGHLKYDLLAHQAKFLKEVRWEYEGLAKTEIRNQNLLLHTALGLVEESIPLAYQETETGKKQPVTCLFRKTGTSFQFHFPKPVHPDKPLVVDPEFLFLTYSNSVSDNWANSAVGDQLDNAYTAGTVYGPSFPTSTGAFDLSYNGTSNGPGTYDMAIQKFNPTGTQLLSSTFLGGLGADTPHSLNIDSSNHLLILGTTSSLNFPTTASAFQPGFQGGTTFSPLSGFSSSYEYSNGSDMVVVRFNEDLSELLGSTYIGGSANDGINAFEEPLSMNYGDAFRGDICSGPNGTVLVASLTQSNDFPVVAAHQNQLSGDVDGVVFRLNANFSNLDWSTYLGGSEDDLLYSIQPREGGRIVVCGGSRSIDFPGTANGFQPGLSNNNGTAKNDRCDAVLALFDWTTGVLLNATYTGTDRYDLAFLVQTDVLGNVYVMGQTDGFIQPDSGKYGNAGGRVFFQKFNPGLTQRTWSTALGSLPSSTLVPSAFLVDTCGRIYFSGWSGNSNFSPLGGYTGGNTNGFPTTPDALKAITDGSDFYFGILASEAASLSFGSFLGGPFRGEHVDGGMSRFDKKGIIYQATCGCRQGSQFFNGTPGSYSPGIASQNCSQGVIKINLGQFKAEFKVFSNVNCQNEITFQNLSINGTNYVWYWGDGDSLASNAISLTHTFPGPGTYIVTLYASNPTSCVPRRVYQDTLILLPEESLPTDTLEQGFCPGDSLRPQLPSYPGITRTFLPHPDIRNGNLTQPLIVPQQTTLYPVQNESIASGCRKISFFKAVLLSDLQVDLESELDLNPCAAFTRIGLKGISNGAESYTWIIGNDTLRGQQVDYFPKDSGIVQIQLVGIKNTCPDFATTQIFVPPLENPVSASWVVRPQMTSCSEMAYRFIPGDSNATAYLWTFGDGQVSFENKPLHQFEKSGAYEVGLAVQRGLCYDYKSEIIEAGPPSVPNLLTSNKDGANDVFVIQNLPSKTRLDVFNRWGKRVFSSPDYSNNWDPKDLEPGTYFFQLQFENGNGCRSWVQVMR